METGASESVPSDIMILCSVEFPQEKKQTTENKTVK